MSFERRMKRQDDGESTRSRSVAAKYVLADYTESTSRLVAAARRARLKSACFVPGVAM